MNSFHLSEITLSIKELHQPRYHDIYFGNFDKRLLQDTFFMTNKESIEKEIYRIARHSRYADFNFYNYILRLTADRVNLKQRINYKEFLNV